LQALENSLLLSLHFTFIEHVLKVKYNILQY